MTDLEPCPFCGDEAALLDYEAKYGGLHYASRCPQCVSCGAGLGYLPTAKKAIAAWNTRAPSPAARERDAMREDMQRIADLTADCVSATLVGVNSIARQALNQEQPA